MIDNYTKYYHEAWPTNPFHKGEVHLQQLNSVQDDVMTYAPRVIRPYLPEQHQAFYQNQPFLVAAALDTDGHMWSTLLTSPTGEAKLVTSPNPKTLSISGKPVKGDALEHALQKGSDLGLVGIEFATKRRNRVNGRVTATEMDSFTFEVDQSFGNCPQYIKPRKWWVSGARSDDITPKIEGLMSSSPLPVKLTKAQMQTISEAETVFTATGYRGEGQDVRFGNDASHRGGPKGFLMVKDEKTLLLPEFPGNGHFNTLGNLILDKRMGITIPDFENGGLLQLSGWAEVDMDMTRAAVTYAGSLRLITFHIELVNVVKRGSLPLRWSSESESRQFQVVKIVQESDDVKSFHLKPLPQDTPSLWDFQAGQHLPIRFITPDGEILRTYSLSGSPYSVASDGYRISVKCEPFGRASCYLHDKVIEGDMVDVNRPAGDFVVEKSLNNKEADGQTLVLLSSGIGVTPLLSMLHDFVHRSQGHEKKTTNINKCHQQLIWIHGARDSRHHPLRHEVENLKYMAMGRVKTHIRYSKPFHTDTSFESQGRIDVELLKSMTPNLTIANFYICGNSAFTSDMEDCLDKAGVAHRCIHVESF